MIKPINSQSAFTIVELLVVIVVIGILATITIVSYTGIANKANAASLQSDLDNASRLLKMYNVDYGSYPITLDGSYCPTAPNIDNKYCLKPSLGNTFTYFPGFGSSSTPQSFTLVGTNSASVTRYSVTDNSTPTLGSSNWIAGIASTALANKWVYNVDLTGTYQYKTVSTANASPQSATGIDPDHPSSMALVADNTVDFVTISYPARQACKAIGGRLPNMPELQAIYTGRITAYGNNFQPGGYWSSTEYSASLNYLSYFVDFSAGTINNDYKTRINYIRCVSG